MNESRFDSQNGITIRRLTIEMLEGLSSALCTICQTEFRVHDVVTGLSCGHGFHKDCFLSWAQPVI